jgi:hypothetical protein
VDGDHIAAGIWQAPHGITSTVSNSRLDPSFYLGQTSNTLQSSLTDLRRPRDGKSWGRFLLI